MVERTVARIRKVEFPHAGLHGCIVISRTQEKVTEGSDRGFQL